MSTVLFEATRSRISVNGKKPLNLTIFVTMAALAENLINLTGFHHILNFDAEEVGGLGDVAVISKNDGFTWLS